MKKIILFLILVLTFSSFTYAFSTSLTDSLFQPGETVLLTLIATTNPEKGDSYVVKWFNGTNLMETDEGTLSGAAIGTPVFETITLDSSLSCLDCYVNTTINGVSQLIYFNVTGDSTHLLEINNEKFTPKALIGKTFAVDFRVRDSTTMKKLDNANCVVYGTDINEAPLQLCGYQRTYAGRGICEGRLDSQIYKENNEYLAIIRCSCGIGDEACYDEDGLTVEKKHGETTQVFIISPWLKVNTITDKDNYVLNDEEILVCANVTNYENERISLEIVYNYRCDGSNDDTDRIIYDDLTELRGISANTTQNQCASLEIKNLKTLSNTKKECYAATDVRVLSKDSQNILFTYPTTSPEFNITSDSSIIYSETEENNMLAITIAFIILIAAFVFFASINKNLWVKVSALGMALIQVIMMFAVLYARELGNNYIALLTINFNAVLIVFFMIGAITLFYFAVNILNLEEQEIEDINPFRKSGKK